MQYIEAVSKEKAKFTSIFLAGGITNCPDWQTEIVNQLKDIDVTIFNPRRKNFPIDDPSASEEQIQWEYERLRKSDILLFWFSVGTLNPIVCFEYGSALERLPEQRLIVGTHPDYERKLDIQVQTQLRNPKIKVHTDLDALVVQIKKVLFIDK